MYRQNIQYVRNVVFYGKFTAIYAYIPYRKLQGTIPTGHPLIHDWLDRLSEIREYAEGQLARFSEALIYFKHALD